MLRHPPKSTLHISNGIIPVYLMNSSPADLAELLQSRIQFNPKSHRPEFQWHVTVGSVTIWGLTREEVEEAYWEMLECERPEEPCGPKPNISSINNNKEFSNEHD